MIHLLQQWFAVLSPLFSMMIVGAIVGLLLGPRLSHIQPARVARVYYGVTVFFLLLGAGLFVFGVVTGFGQAWNTASAILSKAGGIFFGVVVGLSLRRADQWEILREPAIFSARCMAVGLLFMQAGFSKALAMPQMTDFFNQSGYSTAFLKFIMSIEVLAALGLMVPWAAPLVIAGLSIDMFGAIYTHVHNGDPLTDSTGAIGQLVWFAILMTLWVLKRPRADAVASFIGSTRRRFAAASAVAIFCLIAAVSGGMLVRRFSPPPQPTQSPSQQTPAK